VTGTIAQSYLHQTSRTPEAAPDAAVDKKTAKYAPLAQSYLFVQIAVETMRAINRDGLEFLIDLEKRNTQVTDDIRESAFLFQRLSVLIRRYIHWGLHDTFAHTTPYDIVTFSVKYLKSSVASNCQSVASPWIKCFATALTLPSRTRSKLFVQMQMMYSVLLGGR